MHFSVWYLAARCMKGCGMGIIDSLVHSVHYTQKKIFKWKYLHFINDTWGMTAIWGKIQMKACESLSALTQIECFIDKEFQ